jgi:hypothetical protein
MHVQIDRAADAANRQQARNLEVAGAQAVATGTFEGDGRMLGGVQEIGVTQLTVSGIAI